MEQISMDYKPWGGLAGVYAGEQAAQADTMNDQAIRRSALEEIVKQKEALNAQDEMSPDFRQSRLAGLMGEQQSKAATGKLDTATVESKIKAAIAKNLGDETNSKIDQDIALLDQGLATLQSNPNGVAMLDEQVASMSPQAQQLWEKSKATGDPVKALSNYREFLVRMRSDTPTVRGKIAEEKPKLESQERIHTATNASQERIGAGHDAATRYAADARAKAAADGKKDALTTIQQAIKNGKYEAASVAFGIMAMQEEDEDKKKLYMQEAAKYEQMAKEKAAAGGINPNKPNTAALIGTPGQVQTPPRQSPQKEINVIRGPDGKLMVK